MKKFVLFLFCAIIISCNQSVYHQTVDFSFDDVNSFFIINKGNDDKKIMTKWYDLFSSELAFKAISNDYSNNQEFQLYKQLTDPFMFDKSLHNLESRNVVLSEDISEISFNINDKKTIYDAYDLDKLYDIVMKYEGKYCYLWVDSAFKDKQVFSNEELTSFAEKFDKIYEKQIALCGNRYVGNSIYEDIILPCKKISIVLIDISKENIGGYFWGTDFIDNQYSGHFEAIYIDSIYAKDKKNYPICFSTLTHEFAHMLTFVNKEVTKGLSFDVWYTEMISMLVEDFLKEDLEVSFIHSPQGRLSSFIKGDYNYGFKNENNWESSELALKSYANAYAFGAFLVRNYGGAKLLKEICSNNFTNEESVVEAVNKINNLNLTFEDLLKEYCYILINPDNLDSLLPSLNKTCSDMIGNFTFNLEAIDLDDLPIKDKEFDSSIFYSSLSFVPNSYLGSYGFNYVKLEKPTSIKIDNNSSDLIFHYK